MRDALIQNECHISNHTLGIGPVGVEVGQGSLITDLLQSLRRLVVDLEDTTRSPPTATGILVRHIEIGTIASWGGFFVRRRVEIDGALEENWGRQLGGIDGVRGCEAGGEGKGEKDGSQEQEHDSSLRGGL